MLPAAVLAVLVLAGCATGRKLPPYEKPLKPAPVQTVRTTAYTHTEADHRPYARRSAAGTTLQSGAVNSAAADWSRWPVGTRFRLVETGEVFEVDDYGWMLSGTNTIDLYQPSRAAMNRWGVRRVTIEILDWGDPARSYAILKPRAKYAHVRRMLKQLEQRHDL
jgi:3D (Asp-Asp-Asp) domain-containing protein